MLAHHGGDGPARGGKLEHGPVAGNDKDALGHGPGQGTADDGEQRGFAQLPGVPRGELGIGGRGSAQAE